MLGLSFITFLVLSSAVVSFMIPSRLVGQLVRKTGALGMAQYNLDHFKRMIERKKIEVDSLVHRHQKEDDPLFMRMNYMATSTEHNMTKSLKLPPERSNIHRMSVTIDMKRMSPTFPDKKQIVEFSSAGRFAELLTLAGANSFLINTDEMEYGGTFEELKECTKAVRKAYKGSGTPPACIRKDLIIHPIQIAQALESGAHGVLLIASVVGATLEELLDACTIMGTEALVEVHTPNELKYALECKATTFLVNMWNRFTGKLYPNQAKALINMMPMNTVAIAAGNIASMRQIYELGNYGYDGIVLGRNIAEIPDLKEFITDVRAYQGLPRTPEYGMGMKGNLAYTLQP